MASSAFVVPASADTTTIGCRSSRPRTISAARSIASAPPTLVPPNLTTITGARSRAWEQAADRHQLGVEQRGPGGAADGIVPHRDELEVQHGIRPKPPDRDGHA